MSSDQFVHLHMHTEYSLLDGINRVETIPSHIKNLNQKALAITDHGNVSGSYKFYKSCIKAGIQPIIGMEAYYTVQDRTVRETDDLDEAYYHLILLALDNEGLHNLYKLSSLAYTEGMYRKPRIDDALIAEYSGGICATTTCLGSRISQLILKGEKTKAEMMIDHHRAMFDNRLLVELQLHEMEDQQIVNNTLLEISARKNMPLVLTNDCHYTHGEDKQLHEAALCMQTKTTLSNEKRFSFGEIDVHVASHDWMWEAAQKQNIPYEAISNTASVAEMVDSTSYFTDRMNRYPKFQEVPEGLTSDSWLEITSKRNLYNKFGEMPPKTYRDRLDHELKTIKKMGFSDYILIVAQFMHGARDIGVLHGPGRGSAAGSLVAYSMGITEVDPIKYGLFFERFLNIGRGAKPILFNPKMAQQIESILPQQKTNKCNHNH